MRGGIVLLWSAVAVVVLAGIGIFGALVAMDRISFGTEPAATQTPLPEEGKVDTSYTVMIFNASGDKERLAQVREKLISAGWTDKTILSTDGASTDFPKTTVFYVADADQSAALGLADALGGAEVEKSDFYAKFNDSGAKQLTVVIGVDGAASK